MEEYQNIEEQEQAEYSAANIQGLEGLEAVRKRPAMYIGDISEKGLQTQVYTKSGGAWVPVKLHYKENGDWITT